MANTSTTCITVRLFADPRFRCARSVRHGPKQVGRGQVALARRLLECVTVDDGHVAVPIGDETGLLQGAGDGLAPGCDGRIVSIKIALSPLTARPTN